MSAERRPVAVDAARSLQLLGTAVVIVVLVAGPA